MTATADLAPLTVPVKEAARLTGLSTFTIYDRVQRGEIEAVHLGRKVLVKYASLAAFIDGLPSEPRQS